MSIEVTIHVKEGISIPPPEEYVTEHGHRFWMRTLIAKSDGDVLKVNFFSDKREHLVEMENGPSVSPVQEILSETTKIFEGAVRREQEHGIC